MPLIDIEPYWRAGTASIENGSKDLTGAGTSWLANVEPGDQFFGADGRMAVVDTVNSDTSITLVDDWPGATQAAGKYTIYRVPDSVRLENFNQRMVNLLKGGNLPAFGELEGSSQHLPIFLGPGAVGLISRAELVAGVDYDARVDTPAGLLAYANRPGPTETTRGFSVLVANYDAGRAAIVAKESDAASDWSDPAFITGPAITLDVTEVDEVAYGVPPDVVLTPVAGGYNLKFDIPAGMTIQPGTTTTLPPGSDAHVDFVPITGGYRLDIALPKGDTGDIDGVTPFWAGRITADADAAAALTGLGFSAFIKTLIDDPSGPAAITTLGAFGGAPYSVTDWNDAVSPGLALSDGSAANRPNAALGGSWFGYVMPVTSNWVTQFAWRYGGNTDTLTDTYRREINNGVVGAWVPVLMTAEELVSVSTNANGTVVRLPNKWQICFQQQFSIASAGSAWSFPTNFADNGTVVFGMALSSGTTRIISRSAGNVPVGSVTFWCRDQTNTLVATSADVFAFGRSP